MEENRTEDMILAINSAIKLIDECLRINKVNNGVAITAMVNLCMNLFRHKKLPAEQVDDLFESLKWDYRNL